MDIIGKIDRILSEKNRDYEKFFEKKMKEWGIKSPADLSKKDRKKFFDQIDREWKGEKE